MQLQQKCLSGLEEAAPDLSRSLEAMCEVLGREQDLILARSATFLTSFT